MVFHNPYFKQLNPAYVDIIGCPYLNYAKNPDASSIESYSTVSEKNVSESESSEKTRTIENLTSINTDYHNENTLYIIYFLTILGFIVYYLNINKWGIMGHIYLAVYLILLVIGAGAYYLSYL